MLHQRELCVAVLTLTILLPWTPTHGQDDVPHDNSPASSTVLASLPNILVFMADDLGYGDLGCYGNTSLRTPNLDRLASEGVRLTQSLAAESVCTPSRAAFMTGRYAVRSGMAPLDLVKVALFTASSCGLSTRELTISRVAKQAGHTTAFLGKWHLGWSEDRSDPNHHHPLNHGFDYFYGLPLTLLKDFDPREIKGWRHFGPLAFRSLPLTFVTLVLVMGLSLRIRGLGRVGSRVVVGLGVSIFLLIGMTVLVLDNLTLLNSFLYRNYQMVEQPILLTQVTRKLVREGVEFLEQRGQDRQPFFLMVSWLHVHTALAVGPAFRGRSAHGPYGDAVEELDWGIGEILRSLQTEGLEENTLVYFTSDNGGHVEELDFAGRRVGGWNGLLKGGKSHGGPDGGIRVPTLLKWPAGGIPAGVILDEPVSLMDVLPTLASALRVTLPHGHSLDGRDLLPLLRKEVEVSPHDFLFHYCESTIHAVRYRPREGTRTWKLALYHPSYLPGTEQCDFICACGDAVPLDPPLLYDMTSDPGERRPLPDVAEYRALASVMLAAVQRHKESVTYSPEGDMFSIGRLMWRPWRQPMCNFPSFKCSDSKFEGLFEEEEEVEQ